MRHRLEVKHGSKCDTHERRQFVQSKKANKHNTCNAQNHKQQNNNEPFCDAQYLKSGVKHTHCLKKKCSGRQKKTTMFCPFFFFHVFF